jgi:quercetin dioxygenase-like cupin family protein
MVPPRPHPRTERPLAARLLQFSLPNEIARLKSESDWTGGKRAITLVNEGNLRVVLIALLAGGALDEHVAAGAFTAQVLAGSVRFTAGEETRTLTTGDLLALEAGLSHDVRAVDECVLLLTLAQPEPH